MPLAHFTNIQTARWGGDYTPAPKWTEGKLKERGIERVYIANEGNEYKLKILYDSGMIIQYPYNKGLNLDSFLDAILGAKEIKRVYSELDPYGEEDWEE
jgi:hypothetical protein